MMIRTRKGKPIHRSLTTGVGKRVNNHLYLHKDYALEAINKIKAVTPGVDQRMEFALARQIAEFPAFKFNCLRLDLKWGAVRFIEAPDFDTAREPKIGKWLSILDNGRKCEVKHGVSSSILHDKWLWVRSNYAAFDVEASRRWSATYVPVLSGAPKSSRRAWAAQLKEHGLS